MKRVSLPKIDFLKTSGVSAFPRWRAISYDVLTPPGAPAIVRIRVRTPITPRAVRQQILEAAAELPVQERSAFIKRRLRPLDRLLSDDEAAALENYATTELDMERAKTCDWAGDRVQTSRSEISPLSGRRALALARRAWVRRRMTPSALAGLAVFCRQMTADRDAPPAQNAGQMLSGLTGRAAVRAWHEFVIAAGKTLCALFDDFERGPGRAL